MTKADQPTSTPAPADDLSGLKTIGDAELLEWKRQRQGWLDSATGLEDDDERARRIDISDVYDCLILVAPCNSALAAELKVAAFQLALKDGCSDLWETLLILAADQVTQYLRRTGKTNQSASARETPIAEQWAQAVALDADLAGPRADISEAEQNPEYDRMYALEDAVLRGPITSKADAIAKLRASAGLTFERGDRLDKQDEPAFWQAVAWLEAN